MLCWSSYLLLFSENAVIPHCVPKFFPLFGSLYLSWTWHQLFFFDLAWQVSHGVLYTAERPASLGYDLSTTDFWSNPMESLQHLFFYCPLAVSVLCWVQSLICFVMCCFIFPRMSCVWCLRFFVICLTSVNFVFGRLVMT